MTERESNSREYLSGAGIYFVAFILGAGASFAFATYWLEVSPGWLALLVGALFSIVGAFLGENIGDAMVFALIAGIIATLFFIWGPETGTLRAGIIPVVTGLCVGKLIAGVSNEVSG